MTAPAGRKLAANPQLVEDLVAANRILARQGVLDAYGHVSVRSDTDPTSRSCGRPTVTVAVATSTSRT